MDCRCICNRNQKVARGFIELFKFGAEETNRAEEFTVDIELALFPGTVAHSHWSASTPTSQVAERTLAQVMLTANAEHNLKSSAPLHLCRHRAGHPVEEAVGFRGAGRDPERFQRQAGVTNPGITVIPVPFAADGLRQ